MGRGAGAVDGEGEDEVVGGGGWGAEIEEPEVRVAGDGGEEGGRVRGEGGGVGAGVDGEGEEGGWARWVPNSNCTVPGARAECVLGHEVPVHGEDFSHVLFPGLDGKLVNTNVEELDGAIAGGDEDLVLMRFGPGEVEEGVLRVEPFLSNDTFGRQA